MAAEARVNAQPQAGGQQRQMVPARGSPAIAAGRGRANGQRIARGAGPARPSWR